MFRNFAVNYVLRKCISVLSSIKSHFSKNMHLLVTVYFEILKKCLKGTQSANALSASNRSASNRKWEAYLEYSKQTLNQLQAEILIIDPEPYQSTHLFICHDWEFTDGFFQGKPNIDEYFRIRTSVEVRNCMRSESLSKVQGWESLILQIYVTFSINFPNIYNEYLLANVTDWFLLLLG